MKINFFAAWTENAYVEGDGVGGRVILGQLDGDAKEAVKVVVRAAKLS